MIVIGILAPGSELVVEVARRAAAAGARTEVVGVSPAGSVGDRQLVELATAGVGHATVTRSAATGIEPADLDLALRYLPDVRVVVVVAPSATLLAPAMAVSAWSGAALIVVGPLDADASAAAGASGAAAADGAASGTAAASADGAASGAAVGSAAPIVLDPPAHDPDGAFAGVVAALATRLDTGEDAAAAWRSTVAALAIDPA